MRDVKSRPGSLRAERAAVTRRQIVAATRRCFARRGYGATSLREIALEAGVAVQTVYAVFGSKANILRALREILRDDPEADAAWAASLAAPDGQAALTAFARSIRLRWEHGRDIVAIHVEAASVDPAIRDEVAAVLGVRRRGIGELAAVIVSMDPRAGPADRLTPLIDVLTLPEGYTALTVEHGWSPDAYEAWLAGALQALLPA